MISQLTHWKDLLKMQRQGGLLHGQLLAVASGKGGVGKSHLALNLSMLYAQQQEKTLLMDGDAGMADLHLMLGLSPDAHWGHFIEGRLSFEEVLCPVRSDLDLVQGFSGVMRMDWIKSRASEQILRALLSAANRYHRIIIDVGAGVGESSLLFSTSVDLVLLVITPEITSIADSYGMLKTIRKHNPHQAVGLVVNQVENAKQGYKTWQDFCKVSEQFLGISPEYLGYLPKDENLGLSLLKQKAHIERMPESPYAQAMLEVRLRIEQCLKNLQEVHA